MTRPKPTHEIVLNVKEEENATEYAALTQELFQLKQENEKAYAKSRQEKQRLMQAKREAAFRTRQTLTVTKKDYIETVSNFG